MKRKPSPVIAKKDAGPHPCLTCGYRKSAAVHQPPLRNPSGKAWGHEYVYDALEGKP